MVGSVSSGGVHPIERLRYVARASGGDQRMLVHETAGPDWLTPDWFRIGASSLLNDLLLQRQKLRTGHYSGPDHVSVD